MINSICKCMKTNRRWFLLSYSTYFISLQVLCSTLAGLAGGGGVGGDGTKQLVLSCVLCLGEWVMRLPQEALTQQPVMLQLFQVGVSPQGCAVGRKR